MNKPLLKVTKTLLKWSLNKNKWWLKENKMSINLNNHLLRELENKWSFKMNELYTKFKFRQ